MQRSERISLCISSFLLTCLVTLAAHAAAPPVDAVAPSPPVIRYSPTLSLHQLQHQPDSARVELSDGSRISLGEVRRMTRTAQKARLNPPGSLLPPEFKPKPAATGGIPVRTRADLDQALHRPDSDTVLLPSGKRITVGMLKLLKPQIDEAQRRKAPHGAAVHRPSLTGPAIKVSATTDWYAILQKPDATVLETAHGKRITVGELKQSIASGSLRTPAPVTVR